MNHEHASNSLSATKQPMKNGDLHSGNKVPATQSKCSAGEYSCYGNAYGALPVKQGQGYGCPAHKGPAPCRQ